MPCAGCRRKRRPKRRRHRGSERRLRRPGKRANESELESKGGRCPCPRNLSWRAIDGSSGWRGGSRRGGRPGRRGQLEGAVREAPSSSRTEAGVPRVGLERAPERERCKPRCLAGGGGCRWLLEASWDGRWGSGRMRLGWCRRVVAEARPTGARLLGHQRETLSLLPSPVPDILTREQRSIQR